MGGDEGKIAIVQWHLDSWKVPYNNTVLFLPVYVILSMFIVYSVYHRMSKCQYFSHIKLSFILLHYNLIFLTLADIFQVTIKNSTSLNNMYCTFSFQSLVVWM